MNKSFNEKCYALLRKVPRGKVTTYRDIAHALDTKAYRAVGNAMNKNPYPCDFTQRHLKKSLTGTRREAQRKPLRCLLVACHRVIKSSGEVGGFARGTKEKTRILRAEGIEIKNNKIDLKKYLCRF